MNQATLKRSEWSWGRKALAVVMALALAIPMNTGSVMSGVAEAAESREIMATDGWTLSAKWAKSADAANLAWVSDKDETKVVRLEIGYSREGVDKSYAPGELSITVPGIGDAVRGRVAAATDVAADPAGSREFSYDWSYTWDKASDTYTFTNNSKIDAGETVSGSFELLWALKSRETVNLYEKTLYAEMGSAGSVIASTADVKFSYESVKDAYTATLSTAALGSSDGLGSDYRDFIWVKYRVNSTRALKSCGMTDARWEVSLPEGAKVADVRDGNDSAMSYSEKGGVVTIPMKTNLSMWYSNYQPQITVGFPREAYNGAETVVSAKLVGTYADYTQPEVAAQAESRFTMNADDYDFKYTGSMFGTGKTHSYNAKIIYGTMMSDAGADFTYYISALARCAEGDDATVEIVDDFHDALLNNGQMRQLGSDEYSYKNITIPSASYWKNGNGQAAEGGKYTARVLADTGEGFAEVQSVAIDNSSHTVKLPEGTLRVKVAVDGVSSVLNVSNLTVTVNYHPVQEGDMYAPESIAPEGSIRSTVGLIVSKDGEVVNAVGRDSYTGTYADVVADRDMATYGAYVQRGWDDAPITPSGLWQSYTEVTDSGYTADKAGYYNKLTVSSRTTNSTGEKPWAEKIVQVLLLPQGMHANLDTQDPTFSTNACSLESGSSPSSSYVADRASIDVERNWKGSGRDLVRVTYDFTDERVAMASGSSVSAGIPVYIPVEEYMEYGDAYRVTGATVFDTAADNQSGYYNNGIDNGAWAGADKDLLADIDQDGDTSEVATYSNASTVVALAAATYQSSKETVKTVRTDGGYVSDSYVTAGENYTWKMQLITGTTEAADMELADMFDEPGFKGEFAGVDVSFLEKQGYAPVVSYTADGTTWTEAENWSGALSGVAGVKVSLPGQTVPSGSLVYALVNMKAPEDKTLVGGETENGYSATFTALDSNTGQEIGPVAIESVPATLRFLDKVGTIEITKTDAVSGRKLAGATFDIVASDGTKVAEGVTTNRLGKAEVREVPFGTYRIVETAAPSGYVVAAEATVEHNEEKTAVTVADERAKANALLVKRDATTAEPVSGATFVLTKYSGGFWLAVDGGAYTTDENGEILIEDLDWGSYRLTETECAGYELLPRPLSFTVDASNAKGAVEPVKVGGVLGVTNRQKPTTVSIVKTGTDETGADTKVPVDGAEYGLFTEAGDQVATDWTDADGRIEFTGVLYGKYYVKELTAAAGYAIDTEEHHFEITRENAGESVGMRLTDRQKGATLTVIKLDAEGHQRLEGAEFDVKRADGTLVEHIATDDLGEARVRELPWGDYTLTETRAPKGFVLDTEPREFTVGRDNADTGIEIRFDNARKKGTVELVKTDAETGAPLAGAVYDLYATDGTLVRDDLSASGTDGKIAVADLAWGSYYFKERMAPAGYSVSAELVRFAVNASNADAVQTIEATDKAGEAAITIVKEIDAADYVAAQGEPTFIFKVERTDVATPEKWATIKADAETVGASTGTVRLTVTVGGLSATGTYRVTEIDTMRYEAQGGASAVDVNVAGGESEAVFANDKIVSQERSVYSDADSVLNIVKGNAKITGMAAEWTGGVVTERTLDPEKLDVEIAYDDGTTRRLEASEYTLDPAELPGGVNGEYLVNISSEQGGKTWKAAVTVQLDTPKMLKDYTAAELQVIADDLAANESNSEYWAEFNLYLQEDQKWYFTLTDGTRMEFRIVGINHDNRSWAQEDKGDVKKAGITMQAVGLLPMAYQMNETGTNEGGWKASALRSNMNEASGEINQLFTDLLPYVATVDKLTKNRSDGTRTNDELEKIVATSTADQLWIMSYTELVGTCNKEYEGLVDEGEQYAFWGSAGPDNNAPSESLRKYYVDNYSYAFWYERSVYPTTSSGFMLVSNIGHPGNNGIASYKRGVCPCFCFGTSYEEPPEYWIDVPADSAEAKKLGVAGTTLKPADIVAAANDIATNKDKSAYYPMYHSFMEDDVFMKVNWGDGQTYNVRIVGFNHDDITGGVGKAGITWQFVDLLNDTYAMNDTDTNNGGWRDSALRANMNSGTIWNHVPKTLAQDILAVDKLTKNADVEVSDEAIDAYMKEVQGMFGSYSAMEQAMINSGTTVEEYRSSVGYRVARSRLIEKTPAALTSDKLWLMSNTETYQAALYTDEGEFYDYPCSKYAESSYYGAYALRKKKLLDEQYSAYWMRSLRYDTTDGYYVVETDHGGGNGHLSATTVAGVAPCFSMGEPDPEYWIEREDGSIMKPAQINAAAKSIADEGTASPYYAEFKNFMDNGGDWDSAANAPGATFGQALEDGFGLMHIKWGDGREYTARIVGMNHDDKSDGTGKAGLTWQFTGLLYNYYAMHGKNSYSADYNTNNGGWRDTILRKWMNPDDLTEGTSIMDGETDDNRVWRNAPASLQSSIVAVDKFSKNRDDGTATNADLKNIAATATSDKLWIMSYPEIVETCYNGWNGLEGEGSQYGYWNGKVTANYNSNACLKKYRAKNLATSAQPTSAFNWWERSVYPTYATDFAPVSLFGDPSSSSYASNANGVCPCFCLIVLTIVYSMRTPKARKNRRGGNILSVPKYQRNESNVQFVTKAVALEAAVGAMCTRLPKRWMETRARYITDCASDVLKNAVRANAIWPKTEDDLARREGHIQEAVGACQELQARLDALLVARPMKVVKDKDSETTRMVPCVPDGLLFQIAEKAEEEVRLLKGVAKSDRRRWRVRRAPIRTCAALNRADTAYARKRAARRARER